MRRLHAVALLLGACASSPREPGREPTPKSIVTVAAPSAPGPSAIAPTASSPAEPTPADRCVRDPIADAARRDTWAELLGSDARAFPTDELARHAWPDLDGDGKGEEVVLAERACGASGNCPLLLYLSQRGCAKFAGGLWAGWESEEVLPGEHHGVHDLQVYLKSGCAGMEGAVLVLAWDGNAYRQVRRIECSCPDTAASAPRDPACPP